MGSGRHSYPRRHATPSVVNEADLLPQPVTFHRFGMMMAAAAGRGTMHTIRRFQPRDADALVRSSLRAWEPVFASLERVLGSRLFHRLHPDWRAEQQKAVQEVCDDEGTSVWVAEAGEDVAGFVALRFDQESRVGEIYMVAVDPEHQRHGLGTTLTNHALDQFTDAGMTVAMVETGGDPGHAPARALYEQAGFEMLPIARSFQPL